MQGNDGNNTEEEYKVQPKVAYKDENSTAQEETIPYRYNLHIPLLHNLSRLYTIILKSHKKSNNCIKLKNQYLF